MAVVDRNFPILVFPPLDEARAGMDALLGLFVEKGAIVAGAGAVGKGAIELPVVADMHPVTAPIAMIQSFYRFANALAIERGFDPDTPPLLKKVTETRSEEHTSELQSLMRSTYAVVCWTKKNNRTN